MSSINITTIKNAIHAWVVAGSGVAAERVIWSRNNPPRPDGSGAYIALRWMGILPIGQDWTRYTAHPTPTAGAELLATTRGSRRVIVNCTCFPPTLETDATSAWAILTDVLAELRKPSRITALTLAGVGSLKCENIAPIDGVVGSIKFEPRAVMPFAFLVSSEVTETETFIEIVNVEVEVPDNPALDHSFSVDLEP